MGPGGRLHPLQKIKMLIEDLPIVILSRENVILVGWGAAEKSCVGIRTDSLMSAVSFIATTFTHTHTHTLSWQRRDLLR